MAYEQPRVQINQEFTQAATTEQQPLPALIIGPQYELFRYTVAAEKASTILAEGLNAYDPDADTTYDWPNQTAGSVVDVGYTQVWMENVKAAYFPTIGNPDPADRVVTQYNSSANQIQFTGATVLKTNTGYARTAAYFKNRDVQVGDQVVLTDSVAGTPLQTSTVKRLLAVPVAASIGQLSYEPLYDPLKKAYGFAAASVSTPIWYSVDGLAAPHAAPTVTTDTYVGTAGIRNDWAILTCTTGGTAATIDAVKWTITYLSGLATRTNVATSAAGVVVVQTGGGNTVEITFPFVGPEVYSEGDVWMVRMGALEVPTTVEAVSNDWSAVVKAGSTYSDTVGVIDDIIVATCTTGGVIAGGDKSALKWTVVSTNGLFAPQNNVATSAGGDIVLQAGLVVTVTEAGTNTFTAGDTITVNIMALQVVAPAMVSAGALYSGTTDDTYHIVIERSGSFLEDGDADTCARVRVFSATGDSSPTRNVIKSTTGTMYLGTKGLTFNFVAAANTTGFQAGQAWYIKAVAASEGKYNIIELSNTLNTAVLTCANPVHANLRLAKASVQIPEIANIITEDVNWVATTTDITINQDIAVTDALLVDGVDLIPLPVTSGNLFVTHRDLLPDNVIAIGSVTEASQVEALLGPVTPDNPLAQGVYNAALNSAGESVYFVGVASNDEAGYNAALELAKKESIYYGLVPLTFDAGIQAAVHGHVMSMSSPENAKWRICWLSKPLVTQEAITIDSVNEWQATVVDDPTVAGNQYRLVTAAAGTFITGTGGPVRVGDDVLINFRLNEDGVTVYDTYSIIEIRTDTQLVIDTSLAAPINSPVKMQVQRNYSIAEQAAAAAITLYDDFRTRQVFPPSFSFDGVTQDGFFLAAALAGQASGVAPHQGLTNSEVAGVAELPLIVNYFTADQLNAMAENGVWIVTQDHLGEHAYTRHQLTCDTTSINKQEHSIIANFDSICKGLQLILNPYIGRYNVNPLNVLKVRSSIEDYMRFLQADTYTETAGNQVITYTIISVAQDTVRKDKINARLTADLPAPVNNVTVTIVI